VENPNCLSVTTTMLSSERYFTTSFHLWNTIIAVPNTAAQNEEQEFPLRHCCSMANKMLYE
jgi:hypothetical protein